MRTRASGRKLLSWSLGILTTLSLAVGVTAGPQTQPVGKPSPIGRGTCQKPSGKTNWVNELQSHMTITVGGGGRISGSYQTHVGCLPGKSQPLAGFCNGHAIT